ncbi:hypothetical protein GCM10027415_13490 [Humibacter ginsengisoli]
MTVPSLLHSQFEFRYAEPFGTLTVSVSLPVPEKFTVPKGTVDGCDGDGVDATSNVGAGGTGSGFGAVHPARQVHTAATPIAIATADAARRTVTPPSAPDDIHPHGCPPAAPAESPKSPAIV